MKVIYLILFILFSSFINIKSDSISANFTTAGEGYTMNYTPVFVEADESYINRVVDVLITGVERECCIGEIK